MWFEGVFINVGKEGATWTFYYVPSSCCFRLHKSESNVNAIEWENNFVTEKFSATGIQSSVRPIIAATEALNWKCVPARYLFITTMTSSIKSLHHHKFMLSN